MKHVGEMRVYFNRGYNAAGLWWSISDLDGRWELNVPVVLISAEMTSVRIERDANDHDDGRPSAWFAVFGCLSVDGNGHARITPAPEYAVPRREFEHDPH